MRTAVVGLGIIGKVWANHLHQAGILNACWNRTKKSEVPYFSESLEELPSRAEVIHIVLSDEVVSLQIAESLAPLLTERHLIIQSTTIDPSTSESIRELVVSRRARYIEAPFTGSLPAAEQKKTIFFLGGSAEDVAIAKDYLSHLSARQFHIGDNKQACTLKLGMNLQIATILGSLCEALTITRSAGIPDELFFSVFRENASFSGVAALKEEKIKKNEFSPQFSTKHMAKDMRLLQSTVGAGRFGLLDQCLNLLKTGEEKGLGDEDFSAMIKVISAPNLNR